MRYAMTGNRMVFAIGAALALAGCNQGGTATATGTPDSVVINGVMYTRAGSAAGSVAPGITAPGMTAAPTAPGVPVAGAPATGTMPALGRWVSTHSAGDDSDCRELSDVMFNPTSITAFKPDGTVGENHAVTYSNVTPTSFTIYEGSGGRALANVEMTSPTTLTMSKVGGGTSQTCTLVRR